MFGRRASGFWPRAQSPGPWAIAVAAICVAAPLAAQQKVPLVLSHLVLTLDSATYNDVVHSDFMRDQFSAMAAGFLQGEDAGYGARLVGKYSYLIIAPPKARDRAVDLGIDLLSEHPGGLEQIRAQGGYIRTGGVSLVANDFMPDVQPAFPQTDRIAPSGMSARTSFEIIQYNVDAAMHLGQSDSLPGTNLSSARFLRRYFDATKLFSYISGATIAMPVEDIARVVAALKRDNVSVVTEGEGAIVKLDAFTLHLVPPWTGAGVKQLQFALTHALVANPTYRLGPKSQLRFGPGLIAVWDFEAK
jgi:hypothetical protein